MIESIVVVVVVALAIVYTVRRLASGKDTEGACHGCEAHDHQKLSH